MFFNIFFNQNRYKLTTPKVKMLINSDFTFFYYREVKKTFKRDGICPY